jgi:chemosensory pili system protein ChpA (sensor histidine kinase/response regulator)
MKSILLVDDEPMTLRVMRQALEKDGYQITTAFDGKDALEKITASQPDVLITDIQMPRMSGKELCLQIQASMPDRLFPIFITTSLTAHEHRDWSGAIPNLFFVEKPISLRQLRTSLAEISLPPKSVTGGLAQ